MGTGSVHRIGVTIASAVTVAAIAGAFLVQGYVSAQQAAQAAALAAAQPAQQAAAEPTAPQVIYVAAALPAPAVTPAPVEQQQVIHVVVPSTGDDGGGND